ncbi:MAG: hypothetical protein R3281_02700 [Balneolaceae bacterium]|nr:hypothetical protein [Balneolaceae bacterium]
MDKKDKLDRREFLKRTTGSLFFLSLPTIPIVGKGVQDEAGFAPPPFEETWAHSSDWESLNPGYWDLEGEMFRRKLNNVGDRARNTGFPFHYETHRFRSGPDSPVGVMDVDYDPSLPLGMMWHRKWWLTDEYRVSLTGVVKAPAHDPLPDDNPDWRMYDPGNGVIGIAFGGKTQFESFHPHENAPWMAVLSDDGTFGLKRHTQWDLEPVRQDAEIEVPVPQEDDRFSIEVSVRSKGQNRAEVNATLTLNGDRTFTVQALTDSPEKEVSGYFGIASRGLLDVAINELDLTPRNNKRLNAPLNECHSCYVLGDTLHRNEDGNWQARFIGLFRTAGSGASIKISDNPNPAAGWEQIPSAGRSEIVRNEFRMNTAVIDAVLPHNPAETTLYYTVWKDGRNVTGDPRIGTDACGPGTGMVGDVPSHGDYVGRLPRLTAPYTLCGLSCHALHENRTTLPQANQGEGFYVHDQPRYGSFKHLEDYDFQVMLWEDDIWYMELLLYPPSTPDAYKIVTTTICGPTSRWQMMRHWNVLNPGDHDHGMDDVKGPEQIAIRNHENLGQDPEYMIRNFKIVSHLMTGKKDPSGTDNPKRWRKWKMPNQDFTLMIMDSRLWRTSQDTNIWDDEGWGHKENIYDRTDPTRALLGEEQFAWLQENIRTDSSNIICLTGINGLHTVWRGIPYGQPKPWPEFAQRDRVAADYAGWVAAGADRVIDLLGSRSGVLTVYGDVHAGSIIKNREHNLYECSFGPIGRHGGRPLTDGWGPEMEDYDGRPLQAIALYHQDYDNVQLEKKEGPIYWNFLEMRFDPSQKDPEIELNIRNIADPPGEQPRGGDHVRTNASNTGRTAKSRVPSLSTMPGADVRFMRLDGTPIRACRSFGDGSLPVVSFPNVEAGTRILMVAEDDEQSESSIITTV